MANGCSYYSCMRGVPKCNNPSSINNMYPSPEFNAKSCDRCKRENGGIYPHQLKKLDLTKVEVEVVDKAGNILNK